MTGVDNSKFVITSYVNQEEERIANLEENLNMLEDTVVKGFMIVSITEENLKKCINVQLIVTIVSFLTALVALILVLVL